MKTVAKIAICLALPCCVIHQGWAKDVVKDTLEMSKSFRSKPAYLLQGKLSGVYVTSSNGSVNGNDLIYVRGLNSLRTDSQPLWIVDGAPTTGVFNLNPYDIESIEVLKDVSSTAIYGLKGAGGVILVSTKRQRQEGLRVDWHSNMAVSFAPKDTYTGRTAISHNHSVGMSSVNGQSLFNLSAYWRTDNDVLKGNGNNSGLINVLYETKANPVVWFSTNTMLSAGGSSSTTGDFGPGEPPLLTEDYDNDMTSWRIFNTSSLSLNFTQALSLKLNLGIDYKSDTQYVWFGNGTARGAASNGEASICGKSFLRYHADAVLNWYRYAGKHRLDLSGGAAVNGDYDRTNLMTGTDFFSHELRARGLNIHASKSVINNHALSYSSVGAFVKGAYTYGEIVGADAMFRTDWTPEFDSAPALHYAVNAFWRPWEFLKISAGYGVGGEEQMTDYNGFSRFVTGAFPAVDPDLTYFYKGLNRIKVREVNAGAALTVWSGRVDLAAKFFFRQGDDAFRAYSFGHKAKDSYLWLYGKRTPFFDAISSFRSTGVEFDADAVILSRNRTTWTVGLNFTWSSFKLTKVSELDASLLDSGSFSNPFPSILGGISSVLRIGQFVLEADLSGANTGHILNHGRLNLAWDMHPAFLPFVNNLRVMLCGHDVFVPDSDKLFPLARSVVAGISVTF